MKLSFPAFVKDKHFLLSFALFCVLNVGLYLNVLLFHDYLPLSDSYEHTHRFLPDYRISGTPFNFLRALNQVDAQWYIHIAEFGYPKNPPIFTSYDIFDGLSYNFFPLFPILISGINYFLNNAEFSAFILNNILLILAFASLYKLILSLGYDSKFTAKTCLLFFFYPFSIFMRAYFSETLFVLLLIWFQFHLIKKNYFLSALFLAFLTVSRGTALFFLPLFWFYAFKEIKNIKKLISYLAITVIPLALWTAFNFIQTGTPIYFILTRSAWVPADIPFKSFFLLNVAVFSQFFTLPNLLTPYNKVDVLLIIIFGFLLFKSKKLLDKKLWLPAALLWIAPLLFNSTMSFNRYMSVVFQPYIYIVKKLPLGLFCLVFALNYIAMNIIMLFFINSYWIG